MALALRPSSEERSSLPKPLLPLSRPCCGGAMRPLPQEQEANKYQSISLDFHYFYARKVMFVKYASAFICFPGRIWHAR